MRDQSIATEHSWISFNPIVRIRIFTIILLLVSWQMVAVSGIVYEGVVPTPVAVVQSLIEQVLDASMYRDLGYTLFAAFGGFVSGSILAIVIGIFLGANAFFRRAFEPYIMALAATPKIIFLPVLFLVFGLGIESKIAKAAMSAFFPVVFSSISGFLQISDVHIKVGQGFGLNIWQKFRMIYLPAMLPSVFVGMRLGMAMSIIGVLSAEIAYADVGLGFRLIRYADQFNISAMYATIIVIFATVVVINNVFSKFQGKYTRHERSNIPTWQ